MYITHNDFCNLPLISSTNEHVPGQIYRIHSIENRVYRFECQTEKGSYWQEIEFYFTD